MKLSFLGADHEVTGSLHFIEACGLNIAVDYGMEQGRDHYVNAPMPVRWQEVDYILITHAHIDHTGLLPLAGKEGFNGTILTTNATAQLIDLMLRDSAHIQMQEAENKNRRMQREGKDEIRPLYDLNDVSHILDSIRGIRYGEETELGEGLKVRFTDAGHLLGSASIEMWITEEGVTKKLVFSGDIGNQDKPLIRNPQYINEADYVIMESTYGDRFHEKGIDHLTDLVQITQRTLDRGGNVIIPAFAVGRTQELLYLFRQIKQQNLVTGHDGFPVYVDSPLAVGATTVFSKNLTECYDDATRELVQKGINPISFKGLKLAITLDESKAINFDTTPKVIISASGMADAGRIRHHIKYNLWRPECSIVFAGYQAEGTLGRKLEEGPDTVRLFGEDVACRAEICKMAAMSSHADQDGLLQWVGAFEGPERVFLVHGDDGAMETFSTLLATKYGYKVDCPYSGSVFDLMNNSWITVAEPVPYVKPETLTASGAAEAKGQAYPASAAFINLLAAYEKLREAVMANRGGTNHDLVGFTKQLKALYEKWMR